MLFVLCRLKSQEVGNVPCHTHKHDCQAPSIKLPLPVCNMLTVFLSRWASVALETLRMRIPSVVLCGCPAPVTVGRVRRFRLVRVSHFLPFFPGTSPSLSSLLLIVIVCGNAPEKTPQMKHVYIKIYLFQSSLLKRWQLKDMGRKAKICASSLREGLSLL